MKIVLSMLSSGIHWLLLALALLVSALLAPVKGLAQFGVSYDVINATSSASLLALDAKAQEELWVKRVLMGADQDNVLCDNMIGGVGSGKPFVTYDDLSKVDGNTIHVPTVAPLGGPGVQGDAERVGSEETIRSTLFPVKIGRWWCGMGIKNVAMSETVIGSQFDNLANMMLRKRLGRKKQEDMLMVLRANAQTTNTARPNFKPSRESLRSNDVFGTSLITKAGLILSSLGGKPVKIGKDEAGAPIESYLMFGHQHGMLPLSSESNYLEAQRHAAVKGGSNVLFRGGHTEWDGHTIYRWLLRDHDAYGPVGSALLPRAFLGTAITANDEAFTLRGGGSTDASSVVPAPQFFEDFSNFTYTLTNGNTLGASATERYLAIQNLTGNAAGKIGIYAYTVNSGNTITITKRLRAAGDVTGDNISYTQVGNIYWDTNVNNPWISTGDTDAGFAGLTDSHPVGSLIVEINSYGVPFCYSLALAEMAAICGHGSIKGKNAKAARTDYTAPHDTAVAIGVETAFGVNVVERTDTKLPGYVLMEHAYPIDGFPQVLGSYVGA